MAGFIYYLLLAVYCTVLAISLFRYLTRRAPSGDASVDWALGLFYTAGLAGIVLAALFLRHYPYPGLAVLSLPLLFLALPRLRRAWTELYTRIPVAGSAPPLRLSIENNTASHLHVKLECWFGSARSHHSTLYTTFDYYPGPRERPDFLLDAHQTRLLAHKSRYVTVMIYERIPMEHDGHRYMREIQPCMQFFDVQPEAFRGGVYTIVIGGGTPAA